MTEGQIRDSLALGMPPVMLGASVLLAQIWSETGRAEAASDLAALAAGHPAIDPEQRAQADAILGDRPAEHMEDNDSFENMLSALL